MTLNEAIKLVEQGNKCRIGFYYIGCGGEYYYMDKEDLIKEAKLILLERGNKK